MTYCRSNQKTVFSIAAIVFIFTLITVVQADAKQASLKTQLRNNGISMKLERLDRTDGFIFGLSFKGPKKQSIVIAPGFNRMLLVVADGKETILQADGTGKMQIIQADGDLNYVLCLVKAITDFFSGLTTCTEGDYFCLLNPIINLVTDIVSCSAAVAPTE